MKTIVQKFVSEMLIDENDPVYFYDNRVEIGAPVKTTIWCWNINNSSIYANATPPVDWEPKKYLYNGLAWTLNPNYIPPQTPVQE